MTQVNETSRPARTPRRPSAKPHGQWKVDGTAPLNHNEEFKPVSYTHLTLPTKA